MESQQFIVIDEEGYFVNSEGIRITDKDYGHDLLSGLEQKGWGRYVTKDGDYELLVEAFDQPYIALQIHKTDGKWSLQAPYGFHADFELETLTLDDWDRFHGRTKSGVSFVMSRTAQAEFFNLVDDFDDDSITVDGKTYPIPHWLMTRDEVSADQFWGKIYNEFEQNNETPNWDLGEPAAALAEMIPKLKIPKSRIIVLGAGAGHDAALFARMGHIVTAVDFSADAIRWAKERYGEFENIKWVQADIFNLPKDFNESFDVVFEHTCFCAIDPHRRKELIKVWKNLLIDGGHVLGVFFAMDKPTGPPWGGSEWELRQRLKKDFRFLHWKRWRDSVPDRLGVEVLVYAQKFFPEH